MSVDLVHALNLTLVAEALRDGRVDALRLNIVSEQLFAAAEHIEAIRAENERYKAALTKIAGGMDVTLHTGEVVTMVRDDVEAIARAVLSGGQP